MWIYNQYPFTRKIMKSDSRTLRKLAEYENDRQWQDVFNRIVSLAVNKFEWAGLPDTCDPYFMEQLLLWTSKCCIIEDNERGGKLSLPCVTASSQNLYYESSYYRAVSLGYSKPFRAITHYNKDIFTKIATMSTNITERVGVVCFDNIQQYPMINTIMIYTDKIVDAMRALDVAAKQLKIPAIIETDESSKLSAQAAIDNINTNVVAIYVKRNMKNALQDTKSIPTGASPEIVASLWQHIHNLYAEMLTALGINNQNNTDKKERLITDEVNSNNDFIVQNSNYRLDQRKHFCENYKACFGETISVKIKNEEDMINGSVHNDLGRGEQNPSASPMGES